jgi:hypothetical protein
MTERCRRCDGGGWVCENHPDRPWDGTSSRADACGCGAGDPCPDCQPAGQPRFPKSSPDEHLDQPQNTGKDQQTTAGDQ